MNSTLEKEFLDRFCITNDKLSVICKQVVKRTRNAHSNASRSAASQMNGNKYSQLKMTVSKMPMERGNRTFDDYEYNCQITNNS